MKSNSLFADTFFVLDFDRCIGNTDKFHTVLEEVISQETTVSKQQLANAKKDAESRGETFDTIRYVKSTLEAMGGTPTWVSIERKFIHEAQRLNMLQSYARQLISILQTEGLPFGILTYGNEVWQLAKLEAANLLDIPHLVTNLEGKGAILTGWKKSTGFIIPPALTKDFSPLAVDSIVFLDDKAVSFNGMPNGVRGIRVTPDDGRALLPIQQGQLPEGVEEVTGIYGAIELLFPQYLDTLIDKT